jgi:hypothetical protein
LRDVFPNCYKKGYVPVGKREDNDFLYFKYIANESKEKAARKKSNKKTMKKNYPI